jgi:hypothetical protein
MEITIQLDSEHAEQLAYIQQHTNLAPLDLIAAAIEREYQELQSTVEKVNPLQGSSFIGSFQGSPDLATNSKALLAQMMGEKFPSSDLPSS